MGIMYIRLLYLHVLLLIIVQASAQTLVVGVTENVPLKSYDTLQTSSPNGIFIDLLNYIAEKENWTIEYKAYNFHECLVALEKGEIDIMPDLGYTEDRIHSYKFTNEDVMLSWGQVYTNEMSDINNLIDLENKKVAIVKNNVFDDGFVLLASNFNLNCEYIYAEDYNEVFELIENSRVDAGVANRIFGDYNSIDYKVSKTPIIFSPVHLHYAFPNNEKYNPIIETIDSHLKELKEDNNSIYYKIISDYFYMKEVNVLPVKYKVLILTIVIILLVTLLFIFTLRITVKKRTQELKNALQKAQESDQLKSVFLRNLSHEIRTPMNGINGFSILLKDADLAPDMRNRYIDLVISSSEQLLSIVDNILSISLIETGQDKVKLSHVEVNELLDELYQMYSKSLDEKNVRFTLVKSLEDDESILRTDRSKLRQIFTNLLANAVKFTANGHIKFGYILKDDFFEFFVEDTGIGIDTELKEQIFKMFCQEDNSPQRKYGGAGLGLSIAKGYTELLGGEIYFKSVKGEGTTFFFTIPQILS